jgi:exodeoxyribonuclease VIII
MAARRKPTPTPAVDYSAATGLNWSSLKHLARSPLHYRWAKDHETPETDAMIVGRAIHTACLEPMQFLRRYALWEGGVRRGSAWEEFAEANAGKTILREQDYARVEAIGKAVRGHEAASAVLAGCEYERAILWTRNGRACKARLDAIKPGTVADLKSTADLSRFAGAVARYLYHGQLAWYREAAISLGMDPPKCIMIAVETREPYDVGVFCASDAMLAEGDALIDRLLSVLADCEASGSWPGACPLIAELDLPAWAQTETAEVDFGEEIIA